MCSVLDGYARKHPFEITNKACPTCSNASSPRARPAAAQRTERCSKPPTQHRDAGSKALLLASQRNASPRPKDISNHNKARGTRSAASILPFNNSYCRGVNMQGRDARAEKLVGQYGLAGTYANTQACAHAHAHTHSQFQDKPRVSRPMQAGRFSQRLVNRCLCNAYSTVTPVCSTARW